MKLSYFSKLIIPIAIVSVSNIAALAQTLFPVPNVPGCKGVSGVIVNMRGGAGGASNSTGTSFPNGGAGGYGGSVVCTLDAITPTVITSLTYYVGQAGAVGAPVFTGLGGSAGGTGYGNGGNGGGFLGPSGSVGTNCPGGAGGGSSAVLNTTGGVPLLIAAGGGGGGALMTTLNGGNGGNSGTAGANAGTYNYGGAGGTPGAGGAGGVGLNNNGIAGASTFPGNGGDGAVGQQGSQSGGGGGAGYGGGGGGGAGNLPGVGSTIGVNTATGAGGGGANYVAPTVVTTGLANGTATVRGNGIVTLAYYPDTIGGTCTSLCPGGTVTFTETTPGGVWSSSNPTIASVSATSGSSIVVTGGTSAGVVNISYTAAGGYYAFVVVTVLTAPSPISGPTTVCVGETIPLSDAIAGGVWNSGATAVATVGASSGVVTGVSAGNAVITYTSPGGCPATYTITVVSQPAPMPNEAVCVGNTVTLSNSLTGGVWSSSNVAVGIIDPVTGVASGLTAGTTTITYAFGAACNTTALLTVNPLPFISSVNFTGPTTCFGSDGTITLNGLVSGTTYSVAYSFNGVAAAALTLTASANTVVMSGLPAGSYTGIQLTNTATGCVSNIVAATLTDPIPPPPPVITSNQPVCVNQMLKLAATDAAPTGGAYSWTGPDGFTTTIQNPVIEFASLANSGMYYVTYTIWNCVSPVASANIAVHAPAPLINVTLSQTISYGTTIQLNAENALYYTWKPNDGTIDNPNINNPRATPLMTTTYTVYGRNPDGCVDSAFVTIMVDSTLNTGIPSAFTPNGDGLNDVFRPIGLKYQRLVEFRVLNRWGQAVFYSSSNDKGWDGTLNGVPQDAGIYYYYIIVADPGGEGKNTAYKGDVTLIR